MQSKILIVTLSFMSCSVVADVKTLAHDINGNSEVTVQNIGDSACTLNYKNGDYLTSEGFPVFYNFQVEFNNGDTQTGMQSWLPHGMAVNKETTLSFHDENNGKIYEYTEKASKYGSVFYNTDLFTRFLDAQQVSIRQGGVVKNMPVYRRADISAQVKNTFKSCVKNLDQKLKKFCLSSREASKICLAKKAEGKKGYANEIIKDDPKVIAAREAEKATAESAKIAAAENAAKIAKAAAVTKAAAVAKAVEVAKAAKVRKPVEAIEEAKVTSIAKENYRRKESKILSIFSDKLGKSFRLKNYAQYDNVITTKMIDADRGGMVVRITYNTDKGVAYFENGKGGNYSEYSYLEFDLKLIADPSDTGLMVKMDCFYPCSSGNYPIEKPQLNNWQHYKIKLQELIKQPGSTLDITKVSAPFAILPDWGKQRGVVLMVDNVSLTN